MMEIQDLLRGVRSFCDGTSGAFSRETEFAASICTGFRKSKIWEERLENPSGRTYNKTICVRIPACSDAWKRPAVYAHDPGWEQCVQGIAAEYGVPGEPPVQRESQSLGDHPRPSAGGVAPGRTERIMLCKLEKEFSYELPPYYPGKY